MIYDEIVNEYDFNPKDPVPDSWSWVPWNLIPDNDLPDEDGS